MRTLASVLLLVIGLGCADETVGAEAGETTTGEQFDASAMLGCGSDDRPILALLESGECAWNLTDSVGFGVWFEVGDEALPATYDVLSSQLGECHQCDGQDCEDASSCTVELLEVSASEVLARLEAEFPSGSVARTVRASMCPQSSIACP